MDRRAKALKCIDLGKGRGIEIGPLYSPIVLKSEARIYYVDHMSTDDLKKKYQGHPFSVDEIVNVDHVVGSTTLKEALNGKKFDYVIASHVIEHIPDMVSWLKDVSSILKPGGILSLVIPDKRFSFDISRDASRPSEVMGSYLDKLTKANSSMIYDSAAEYREIAPVDAWSQNNRRQLANPSPWNLQEAIRRSNLNLMPGEYVDSHCYVFTPYSFFEIIRRLIFHDLFEFEIASFDDTARNELEFYVSFKKTKSLVKKKQLASLPKLKKPLRTEELEKKVQLLTEQLAVLTESKSWKVTKPLRTVNYSLNSQKTKIKKYIPRNRV